MERKLNEHTTRSKCSETFYQNPTGISWTFNSRRKGLEFVSDTGKVEGKSSRGRQKETLFIVLIVWTFE